MRERAKVCCVAKVDPKMATFLTNAKMAPALAARIETSVRGRRSGSGGTVALRRFVSGFRLVLLVFVVAAIASVVRMRHRNKVELERARDALLSRIHAQAGLLAPEDRRAIARIEPWLVRGSGPYEGDVIADELRDPSALASVLSRPLVYVRGPTTDFDGRAGIATTAATSLKDAFLLCLIEPPASRTESALLAKVHGAYAGGARMESRTSNVRRLHDAEAGLPFLQPSWEAQVRAEADLAELSRLNRAFTTAPTERALTAARARLLLYAMDDSGDRSGVSELDGERPHDVRIGLVELGAGRVLLRLRKHVDPSWISIPNRPEYASGLDSCALALDVRTTVIGG